MTNPNIPTPWVTIVVKYGEKRKHLHRAHDTSERFYTTEEEAQKYAEGRVSSDPSAIVLILRADRLVMAKAIQFETISMND